MKNVFLLGLFSFLILSCNSENKEQTKEVEKEKVIESNVFPDTIRLKGVAQNPEGIEYNKNDQTFFLSSLNAAPVVQIALDGTSKPFTSGEKFPLSTAGLQIDYKNNRLLVAGFNGTELMDADPTTKGTAFLRAYSLDSGEIEQDINLSSLAPDASAYFANDIAIDNDGNAYISDWYARVIYKVDLDGNPSIFWNNETGIPSGPNGLDFHPDGYLLVSILNVNDKGLYSDYGLIKIPVSDSKSAQIVAISNSGYAGFDGMVINAQGNIIGVTNNGKTPGGNTLIELSGKNDWASAEVVNSKSITASTTVAITPDSKQYVINQDFTRNLAEDWTIERIEF